MHKVRVFLNGAASSTGGQDWVGEIRRGLFRSEVDFVTAGSLEKFQEALREAAQAKVDVVVSIGGDGTINTLLQELAKTDTSFLVIPAGTANDLARELGIGKKIRRAIECIRKNEAARMDLISINGNYMATNGGIGLVSDVALNINSWRKSIPGFRRLMSIFHHHTYSAAVIAHLAARQYRYYRVRVESQEFQGDLRVPMLLVNNQPFLGGAFPVAPKTRNDDGKFNVTIFTHNSWSHLVNAVYRVRQRLPVDHDQAIISFETDRLKLRSLDETPLSFFGDGEFLSRASELDIQIHPRSLRVFRPLGTCGPQVPSGGDEDELQPHLGEPKWA